VSEEKRGMYTILFFDKPNMDFVEKETLGQKINHDEFFGLLAAKEEEKEGKGEFHIRFYWQSNEDESPYGKHLKQLRIKLQAQGIRFISIETGKDVDIAMLNDMFTILFDVDDGSRRPKKIILCSGDKAFSVILGAAKRRFDIPTTVISGRDHCAEVLRNVLGETLFVEDMVRDNEELLLGSSASIE
jgi:uncharacterized LabA/DUF88 family protein